MDRLGFLFSQAPPHAQEGPAIPVRTSSQKIKPTQRKENLKALHAKSQSMPECSSVPDLQKTHDIAKQQQQQQQQQLPYSGKIPHGPRTAFHAHVRNTWNQDGPILEVEENSAAEESSPAEPQSFIPRARGSDKVKPMVDSRVTKPNVQEARVRKSIKDRNGREKPAVPQRTSPVQMPRTSADDSNNRPASYASQDRAKTVDLGVRAHTLDSRPNKKAPKPAPRPASYQKPEMDGEPDLEEKLMELLETTNAASTIPESRLRADLSSRPPPLHSTPVAQQRRKPSIEEPRIEPIRSDSPRRTNSPRLASPMHQKNMSNSVDSTVDESGFGFDSVATDPTLTSVSSLDTLDLSRAPQTPTSPRGIPPTIEGNDIS